MNTINNKLLGFDSSQINKKVIPDNEYLPFLSVTEVLMEMNTGDIVVWPISKASSIRITVGRMKQKNGRTYKYTTNKVSKTISVCRVS